MQFRELGVKINIGVGFRNSDLRTLDLNFRACDLGIWDIGIWVLLGSVLGLFKDNLKFFRFKIRNLSFGVYRFWY